MKCVPWTSAEEKFISDSFPAHSDKWIAEWLSRTEQSVRQHRLRKLKLIRQSHRGEAAEKESVKYTVSNSDINRRKIFMSFMARGKKLLGNNEPCIDMDKLIGAFQLFENKVMQ
jgi:hypothetical protein